MKIKDAGSQAEITAGPWSEAIGQDVTRAYIGSYTTAYVRLEREQVGPSGAANRYWRHHLWLTVDRGEPVKVLTGYNVEDMKAAGDACACAALGWAKFAEEMSG